jgi:hypothetical protein
MFVVGLVSKWYWNTFGMHFKAPIQNYILNKQKAKKVLGVLLMKNEP